MIDGGYDDLYEIAQWVRSVDPRIYPNVLQRKWPVNKRYFRPMDHLRWFELVHIVDNFSEVLTQHHKYIWNQIYQGRIQLKS